MTDFNENWQETFAITDHNSGVHFLSFNKGQQDGGRAGELVQQQRYKRQYSVMKIMRGNM